MSKWASLLFCCFLLVVNIAGALAQAVDPTKPQTGEILLEGKISVLTPPDGLVLEATSFTLPTGRTSTFPQAKSKTIAVSAQTLLQIRANPKSELAFDYIKPGAKALIVGPDAGSGKALTARIIAVWDSETNGVYRYRNLPPKAAPVGNAAPPPAVAPPPIAPLVVPPVNPPAPTPEEFTNLLPFGNFERAGGGLDPAWKVGAGNLPRVMQEPNGNHFVQISNDNPKDWRDLSTTMPLSPDWATLKISARLKVKNLKIGDIGWKTGRVWWNFADAQDKIIDYGLGLNLTEDGDWKTLSTTVEVPPNSAKLLLKTGMVQSTGVLGVDDITIVANAPLDFPLLRPDLPEGAFEEIDEKGRPKGWMDGSNAQLKLIEENGNHYLRLTNDEPEKFLSVVGRFKLNPAWKSVIISARLRGTNIKRKPDAKTWETARVGYDFENAQGQRVGPWPPTLELLGSTDWKVFQLQIDIPRGAALMRIVPLMHNTTGTFDIDDIIVRQAEPLNIVAPVHEWTRTFPEGTFETKDEQGNPAGWQLDHPGAKVLKEDGNQFLRLSIADRQSTVLLASEWKIKPGWKEVIVRARLRAINLRVGANPLDGARLRFLFLNEKGDTLTPIPESLSLQRNSDWTDMQVRATVPPGASTIKLIPSLSRATGNLDIDDILIEPVTP